MMYFCLAGGLEGSFCFILSDVTIRCDTPPALMFLDILCFWPGVTITAEEYHEFNHSG